MISIGNAVELKIKTYLVLPKRVTGITGLFDGKDCFNFRKFRISTLLALHEWAIENRGKFSISLNPEENIYVVKISYHIKSKKIK